jgi:3',5'-nucleoside bisphosphate phosphatase
MIDLHLHTNCSDGKESPETVAAYAVQLRMEAVSITDHDTVAGIARARATVDGALHVVSGVELSASDAGSPIHILGYGIDEHDAALSEVLQSVHDERETRAKAIIERLNRLRVDITFEMVRDVVGDAPITRAHIGYALVGHGFVRSQGEAFGRYLSNRGPAFVLQETLTPVQAIESIHAAGGVAIIAHPGITKRDELIKSLVGSGLDGLESFHPNHTRTLTRYYERLASRYGLITTGGSDAHGLFRMTEYAAANALPSEMLARLDEAISHAQSAS